MFESMLKIDLDRIIYGYKSTFIFAVAEAISKQKRINPKKDISKPTVNRACSAILNNFEYASLNVGEKKNLLVALALRLRNAYASLSSNHNNFGYKNVEDFVNLFYNKVNKDNDNYTSSHDLMIYLIKQILIVLKELHLKLDSKRLD